MPYAINGGLNNERNNFYSIRICGRLCGDYMVKEVERKMTVYNFLIKCFTSNIDNLVTFIVSLSNSGEYTCSYCQYYHEWLKLPDKDLYNYCRDNCKKGVKKWLQSNNKEYIDEIAEEIDWSDEN